MDSLCTYFHPAAISFIHRQQEPNTKVPKYLHSSQWILTFRPRNYLSLSAQVTRPLLNVIAARGSLSITYVQSRYSLIPSYVRVSTHNFKTSSMASHLTFDLLSSRAQSGLLHMLVDPTMLVLPQVSGFLLHKHVE